MGFFAKIIEKLFGSNGEELLGDGNGIQSKSNGFKDRLRGDNNLTPEQWQRRFLEENNCGEYISNPIIFKYLTSIPEIECIKDEESFKKAKDYNFSFGENSNKSIIHLKCKFRGIKEEKYIEFSKLSSSYRISEIIETKTLSEEKGVISTQNKKVRIFDKNSGIEIKRKNEYKGQTTEYTRDRYSIGTVTLNKYENIKPIISKYSKCFYDLTTAKSDIATLDGVDEIEPEEFPIGNEDSEFLKRLDEKIANSSVPEGCRKYQGESPEYFELTQ